MADPRWADRTFATLVDTLAAHDDVGVGVVDGHYITECTCGWQTPGNGDPAALALWEAHRAQVVLTALADIGALAPLRGRVHSEWAMQGREKRHEFGVNEDLARHSARAHNFPLLRQDITSHTGRWIEVTNG